MDYTDLLLGGAVTLLVAFLTSLWGRQGDKERRADERQAEEDRWKRQEFARRKERGDAAASAILTTVDEMAILLGRGPEPGYEELEPFYLRIRQQSTLLLDEATRLKVREIADNLYYHSQAEDVDPALTRSQIAYVCSRAAADVMTAYLHDAPIPPMARFDKLTELHKEGGDLAAERYGDERDPLSPE
jgi:hypothetical protein